MNQTGRTGGKCVRRLAVDANPRAAADVSQMFPHVCDPRLAFIHIKNILKFDVRFQMNSHPSLP